MDWSIEVLVTRSELDEKRARMAELEQQVRGEGRGHRVGGRCAGALAKSASNAVGITHVQQLKRVGAHFPS